MPPEAKALGYVRVSKEERDRATEDDRPRDSASIAVQTDLLQRYCAAQVHAPLMPLAIIKDDGISGAVPLKERPGGQQLLEVLAAKKITNVVAFKLDRLFRNTGDALQVVTEWDRSDIALHLVDLGGQSVNTKSAVGKFMFTMLAGAAELERNMIAERTTLAIRYKKAHREAYNHTPYGFKRNSAKDKRLYPDPAEYAILQEIKKWRKRGWSYQRVAEELNERGVPTKKSGQFYKSRKEKDSEGKPVQKEYRGLWSPGIVHYILKHAVFAPPEENSQPLPGESGAPASA